MNNKHARLFCLRIKSYCAYRSLSLPLPLSISLFRYVCLCYADKCLFTWKQAIEAGGDGEGKQEGGAAFVVVVGLLRWENLHRNA